MEKPFILSDPAIMNGKPVVRGTRITVEHILEELGAGRTAEDLIAAHPTLTNDAIRAAIAYAARVLRNDTVYFVKDSDD